MCKDVWDSQGNNINCFNQSGCAFPSCDGDLPWCLVTNPYCASARGNSRNWAYCTPSIAKENYVIPCMDDHNECIRVFYHFGGVSEDLHRRVLLDSNESIVDLINADFS